jgi:uncharacterized protein YndB with AHSA1/START domain
MTAMTSGDTAAVTVFVAVTPEAAFDVFTQEIDLWWRQGPQFRIAGRRRGQLAFEGGVGGRLFETFDLRGQPKTIVVGRITEWDRPARLVFEWRGVNFKPDEKTRVEVGFVAQGRGTLVTVRHSGWSSLRDDHPARHGLTGAAFSRMIGMWWGDLMRGLHEHLQVRESPASSLRTSPSGAG